MINIKTEKDIEHLQHAGHLLAKVLESVKKEVRVGVTTKKLDDLAEKLIKESGGESAFKHYRINANQPEYPTTLCTSVNNEVVHAPASKRVLRDGDIIGLDIGLKYFADKKWYFVDMAQTVAVGKVSPLAEKLIKVTKKALELGIAQVKIGGEIADIGRAVQQYVESQKFSVVRELVGHGVGYAIHEDPRVPNYVEAHAPNIKFEKGMVLAIEPMVNAGEYGIATLSDGWTIVTDDDSLSAHFEHTIAVTKDGCKILTK